MVLLSAPVVLASLVFLAMVGVVGWLAWDARKKTLAQQHAADDASGDGPVDEAPESETETED